LSLVAKEQRGGGPFVLAGGIVETAKGTRGP